MINRAELKANAKAQIKGNIGILFVCVLLAGLIMGVTVVGPIVLAPAFGVSMCLIYLGMTKGKKPEVSDIFNGFKDGLFGKAWWLNFITGFFIMLWSCLFMIPGIIKMYAYSMAPYILAENPTMTAREALNESKRITKGHKGELFVLQLSFFWWYLLCGITFGIAYIYVAPYISATTANFYNAIKQA